jgi:hypothetical protein
MASSINSLSYLDPGAYQHTVQPSSSAGSSSGSTNGVSATDEIQAIESQGDFKAYLTNSIAVALLQPANSTDSQTTDSATLISNMMQQVLGAYHAQTPAMQTSTNTPASSVNAVG